MPGSGALLLLPAIVLSISTSATRDSDVVTRETHYNPLSVDTEAGDVLFEVRKLGRSAVHLGVWRLSGCVHFTFPGDTTIPARGDPVVATIDAALFEDVELITGGRDPWGLTWSAIADLSPGGESVEITAHHDSAAPDESVRRSPFHDA